MERVLANLYRIDGESREGQQAYSYLLLRDSGNVLICHQSMPSPTELSEIEDLGGVASQWVCHHHDADRDGGHDLLYKTFRCSMFLHKADRSAAKKKMTCNIESFSDDGLMLDDDFLAIYLPTCTRGHSVFCWRDRGKFHLFSSHALSLAHGNWQLSLNRHNGRPWGLNCRIWQAEAIQPALGRLSDVKVSYVHVGYTEAGGEPTYRLSASEGDLLGRSMGEVLSTAQELLASPEGRRRRKAS